MKKIIRLACVFLCLLAPYKVMADEMNKEDMFSNFIKENQSLTNKSTELTQDEYVFQWYPYVNVKYTSKSIKGKEK